MIAMIGTRNFSGFVASGIKSFSAHCRNVFISGGRNSIQDSLKERWLPAVLPPMHTNCCLPVYRDPTISTAIVIGIMLRILKKMPIALLTSNLVPEYMRVR